MRGWTSLGVVAAIVPWNFPLMLLSWKVREGSNLTLGEGLRRENCMCVYNSLLVRDPIFVLFDMEHWFNPIHKVLYNKECKN